MHRSTGLGILCVIVLTACGGSSGGSGGNPRPPTATGGLDQRPQNLSCVAPALNPGAGAAIDLNQVFDGLPALSQPLGMLQAPGDSSRWFVLEKTGRVRTFANTANVNTFDNDFIDLAASFNLNTNSEGGLLGMAFHPDFANNREVFLSWTEGTPMVSVIARFTSLNGGVTLDPGSRQDIITVNQDSANHNGGDIAFGNDGYLYVGFGDGGGAGDPNSRAQDTTNLLGAYLRLDVDGGTPYAIPGTNRFAGNPMCPADHSSNLGCPEIYAWGFRNPWSWSIDRTTGDIWAGDVGQTTREEIDIVQLNGNYGWDCREGLIPYSGTQAASCSTATGLIDPVHDYPRTEGTSVTGGYVYRGSALPALFGDYVFADYGSGRIWRLTGDGAGGWTNDELIDTDYRIAGFGQDNDGELYVIDIVGGALYQIVDAGGAPATTPVPAQLSATGCVSVQTPSQPATGLIAYDLSASFWSDGASKQRWLAIPNGTTIDRLGDGDFTFPPGSVLMKHFQLNGTLIETRLLMRHTGGEWAGYSYEWNTQQTDATLVQGGKIVNLGAQNWIFPSENDCLNCHTAAAGFALGPEDAQLNHDFTYSTTGRTANQLQTLDQIGIFSSSVGAPTSLPALVAPSDISANLEARARAYLHTNCAQCHRPNGPTPSSLDLRFQTSLDNTGACDAVPQAGDLGLGASARVIAPGDPANSVLLARMNRRDAAAMPPLGSAAVDTQGVALIRDWIANRIGCQ